MEAQLKELLPFLRDRNPQVRQLALSNLVGQTTKESPYRNIFFSGLKTGALKRTKDNDVISALKLLCRDQVAIAHDAFKALVNLSDSAIIVPSLSESAFLMFIVAYIINPQSILADLASMLLSNLSSSAVACSALLTLKISVIRDPKVPNGFYATQSHSGSSLTPVPYPSGNPEDVLALPLLMDAYVQGAQAGEPSERIRKGELHFLSSVFANVAASSSGRDFLFTPRQTSFIDPKSPLEYPLSKLVSFTEHPDVIRRGGTASTLKNCAFHVPAHRAMLSPESSQINVPPSEVEAPGIDILPYLLLPLAGPEELDLEDQEKLPEALQFLPPTKTREFDATIRLTHVETLLLLCHTRWGRDYLRQHGVYEIVRAAHENETVDKISEHIERLVTLLKGDEPSDNSVDNDSHVWGSTQETGADPESDEDDKIVEV